MAGKYLNNWGTVKKITVSVLTATIIGAGGALASHERRISKMEGSLEKIDMIYDDVKTIKDLLMEKGLE